MSRCVTKEEEEEIKKYLDQGVRPNAIATKLRRSSNCIYEFVRNNKLSDKVAPYYTRQKAVDAERQPEDDLASLPDNKLFKHINYAIP